MSAIRTLAVCTLVVVAGCTRPAPGDANVPAAGATAPQARSAEPVKDDLAARAIHRRAVEAVSWGMPAVNFQLMVDALKANGGDFNQILYWPNRADWRNQTLTPNPDVIYVMPFYDTTQGPIVLEIPAANGGSITGTVDDGWQTAIEDVGPAGVDKGRGGKYLITPPGYKDTVPAGYIAMPSPTYAGYALLRSNVGKGTDAEVAKAAAYARTIKLYPLARAADPPATTFVDATGKMVDATIPYDARFFEKLHAFVQREPWFERDRAMIDPLRTLGIEKGKPYAPDAKAKGLLDDAAAEAREWMEARYAAAFTPSFFPNSRWAVPVDPAVLQGLGSNYARTDSYPIDGRGVTYTFGFFSAKHLGEGQFYLLSIADKEGKPLDGGNTYRLVVPPKAPVSLYWSATAYDKGTHALIRDVSRASRASTSQGLKTNDDGSVTLYFGPKAPDGNESNWVPTQPGQAFEVLFRLYGPEKRFFDKAWQLPDLEKV